MVFVMRPPGINRLTNGHWGRLEYEFTEPLLYHIFLQTFNFLNVGILSSTNTLQQGCTVNF